MGVVSWIILGGAAGWIASTMTRRTERMEYVVNIIIGAIGAFLGGFTANLVSRNPVIGFTLSGLFVAILGTLVFLAVANAVQRR